MSLTLGLIKERADDERRVALDPSTAKRLSDEAGVQLVIERGAGVAAGHPDDRWPEAQWCDSATEVAKRCQLLLCVQRPSVEILSALPDDAVVIGQLAPHQDFQALQTAAQRGVRLISMELVPRITRAQAMDVLSSQATVAGYKAVIAAAHLAPRLLPMLTTAAGTLRPAKAVIIGAGVAGLQAIATARRLGAQVEAYDIRAAAREQVESLGARMIDTGVDAETEGGYARELSDDERAQQAEALAKHLAKADVVISTAAIPGRRAPLIITQAMVEGMQPGSVIVDLAASSGGNCELTQLGQTIDHHGVLIHGPSNLPSSAPLHASEMYARNLFNLLKLLITDGELTIDRNDEVVAGCLLSDGGQLVHPNYTTATGS
jgi:NAD(P) transhydrogenase subunit alpha